MTVKDKEGIYTQLQAINLKNLRKLIYKFKFLMN